MAAVSEVCWMHPDEERLPALTEAEGALIDRYLAVVDLVARINPARSAGHTYAGLRAAQALVAEAVGLRDALQLMFERGEREIHSDTLARALRVLDGVRRSRRVTVPNDPEEQK
jgi:hypothetical protein